jgi:hypothetical protein
MGTECVERMANFMIMRVLLMGGGAQMDLLEMIFGIVPLVFIIGE